MCSLRWRHSQLVLCLYEPMVPSEMIPRTLLLNVLSLPCSCALGDSLGEESHELAIARHTQSASVPPPCYSQGSHDMATEDALVTGEARVGAQVLLSDNLVGW